MDIQKIALTYVSLRSESKRLDEEASALGRVLGDAMRKEKVQRIDIAGKGTVRCSQQTNYICDDVTKKELLALKKLRIAEGHAEKKVYWIASFSPVQK